MRILHNITGAALMAAFVIGCSKSPSQPATTSSTAVRDLGVVSLSDAIPQYLAIRPNKSYALTGAASSNGMTKIVMEIQETNADMTVKTHDLQTLLVTAGHPITIATHDGTIRFTPEVK